MASGKQRLGFLGVLSGAAIAVLLLAAAALPYFPRSPLRASQETLHQGSGGGKAAEAGEEPWSKAQSIQPAEFAKELEASKDAKRPAVVCVGFHALYEGAHVPGATFHGPASSAQGLEDLKKWAGPLPRALPVVIYCGCCPLDHCPNARPAFLALRAMGFTHLRVLLLPHDFNTDWIEKNHAVAKGK